MNLEQLGQLARNVNEAPKGSFADKHPAEYLWIQTSKFDFAVKMRTVLQVYPGLTEGQLNAVRKCMAYAPPAKKVPVAVAATDDFDRFRKSLVRARESGLKWPRVTIGELVFTLAGEESKNPGAVYVKSHGTYLAKIDPEGRFSPSRECSAEARTQIVQVCKDPLTAAIEHGKLTGYCSCCGRHLTNETSVNLGIGPICREKYGW